jgi:peptide/nickel transport system permease protein
MSPLARLLAARLATSLLTLLIVSVLVFAATEMLPGDVAQAVLGQSATPDAVAALRASMHLDQPAWLRYLGWLGGLLTLHPGRSLVNDLPVASLIGSRLPNSLLLAGLTAAVAVPGGAPAWHHRGGMARQSL